MDIIYKFNLLCPSFNSETEGGQTFQTNGAKLWNSIPLDNTGKTPLAFLNSSVNFFYLRTLTLNFSCVYLDLDF